MSLTPEQENALNTFVSTNNLKPVSFDEPKAQDSIYGKEKDEQYLALGKFLKENSLAPVEDEKTLELLTKTDSSTSGQIGSYFAGGANNIVKYLASGAKFVGAKDTAKTLDNTRKHIEDKYITNKYSGMVGDMVLDPINLAPAGLYTKGANITAKSVGTGMALGAGTSLAKDYGNSDVSADSMALNAGISGLFWGGMNGFFASGAYDKLATPVKKKLFGENYGATTHNGNDVVNVTPEQQEVLASMRANPEQFGLHVDDVKSIPSPLEARANPDGSYGVGERIIVDENKGTNYQPNWMYGNAEHPPVPYDTRINTADNISQSQPSLSFNGERQGLLPNNSQSNMLPPPKPRPPQTPMEAIETIVHGKVHMDAPVAPVAVSAPQNPIINSVLPNSSVSKAEPMGMYHYSEQPRNMLSVGNTPKTGGQEVGRLQNGKSDKVFLYGRGQSPETNFGVGNGGQYVHEVDVSKLNMFDSSNPEHVSAVKNSMNAKKMEALQNDTSLNNATRNYYASNLDAYNITDGRTFKENVLKELGFNGEINRNGSGYSYVFDNVAPTRVAQVAEDAKKAGTEFDGRFTMASEALPSMSLESGQKISKLDLQKQHEYHAEIQKLVTDENGFEHVLKDVGFEQVDSIGTKEFSPSAYEGHVGAGEQTGAKVPTFVDKDGFENIAEHDIDRLKLAGMIKAFLQDQDAVTFRYMRPAKNLDEVNSLSYNFGRPISHDEMKALSQIVQREMGDDAWKVALTTSKDGIDILGVGGLKGKAFQDIAESFNEVFGKIDIQDVTIHHNTLAEKGYIEGVKDDNQFREQFKLLSSKLRQGERDRNFGGTTSDKLQWGSDDMYSEALFKKRDEIRSATDDFIKRNEQQGVELPQERTKLKRVDASDIADSHGGIDFQKLNDGEMVAHDNQVWFKKEGKVYSSLDNKPQNYEDLPEYPQIEAYQRHLDSMRGGFTTGAMAQNLVAGSTGGAVGATQGDNNDERLRNALIGATVGAGGLNALSKVMRSNSLKQSQMKLDKYNELKTALLQKEKMPQVKAIEDNSPVRFAQSNDNIAKGIDANGVHIDRPNTLKDNTTPFYAQGAGAFYGIEEGENGEFKFDPEKAMIGVAGGMIGAKAFSSKSKETVVNYVRKVVGDEATKQWGDATNDIKRLFTNTLSANYMAKREDVISAVNGVSHKLENLHYALNSLDEEARVGIHKALVGEGVAPKGTENLVGSIRKEVDTLSNELVEHGVLSKETFDEWKGFYLHRSYEKDIRKSLNDLMKGNFEVGAILNRGKTETITAGEYANRLSDGSITQDMLNKPLREGGIRVEQRGNKVEIRRDWTPDERTSMGEIVDASYTVPETLLRMHRMVENAKFLKQVSEMVDDSGVKVVYTPEIITKEFAGKSKEQIADILDKEGFKKLGDNAKYGALSGQWVRKDVASDITKINDEVYGTFYGKESPIADLWMKYMRTWKMSKTVWNAPAHVNNMVSNLFLMHLSGIGAKDIAVNYGKVLKVLKDGGRVDELARKKMINSATPDELRELAELEPTTALYREAQEMGLFGRSQLQDALMGEMNIAGKSLYAKATDKVSHWYQMEDVASRVVMYKILREQHNLSAKEAKSAVTSIMPDYTKPLPEGFRKLRDSGIAPFISWSYYTLPSIAKALKTKGGAIQATKVIATLGAMEYAMTGMTPLDNIPFMDTKKPEDLKGRGVGIGKNGDTINTLKVDKWIPYLGFLDPVNYAKGMFSGVTTSMAHNLMTAGTPNGVTRMYDNYPVTRKDKSFGDKILDYGKYYSQAYVPVPQEAYNLTNFAESMMRDEKKRKNSVVMLPKSEGQEIWKLLGVNSSSYSRSGLKKEQTKK
ncbi:MAG: hypothetical protein EOL93_00745 [Epsilonproteobacteria bacterium]|nr:hypothetical protein [Campylobacterota bacterium]